MKLPTLRLFTKLALAVSGVMIAAFLSFGVVTSKNQTELYRQALFENSRVLAGSIASRCFHYYLIEDYAAMDEALLASVSLPNVVEVTATDLAGSPLGRAVVNTDEGSRATPRLLDLNDPVALPTENMSEFLLPTDDQKLVIWRSVGKPVLGWIRVVFDLTVIREVQSSVWSQTVTLVLIWLTVSIFTILGALKNSTGAIRDLSLFARDLQKNKGQTIVIGTATREIQHLSDCLNHASLQLKSAEKSMQAAILERETLLKEIHHRVKNNMNIISSLLTLETAKQASTDNTRVYQAVQGRIRAMSLVHEQLYKSINLAEIDAATYIQSLIENITKSFPPGITSEIKQDILPISIGIDELVPLGLIANELLTNAFKYATDASGHLHATISLQRVPPDKLNFSVSDEGCGLPADFDTHAAHGMGLTLVKILTSQLQGELKIERHPTRFSVIFPEHVSRVRADQQ